jgi:site-specific DNA-adenine methylase
MQQYPDAEYWINDADPAVYCMWKNLIERPEEMVRWMLKKKGECSDLQACRELNKELQKTLREASNSEFEMGCSA